ncbi:alpha/beta-hydrolase family protein [uncultured Roseibium sp.]|uniref:alpha/beta hydrolase n=1 Tax=uncultured Roseibium sp. TaxID=1936171 RepID=UPI0026133DBF|nr:alpha/beta-hydrolase family protein [uncultured Roseibium sp.]
MKIWETAKAGWSAFALVLAISFFGAALTPSLMPRDPLVQAALCGFAAALGYETVLLVRAVWRYLELPEIVGRPAAWWNWAALTSSLTIIAYSLTKAASWQDATRAAIGMMPLESAAPVYIFLVGSIIALGLWLLFRLAGVLRQFVALQLERMIPRRLGVVLSVAIVGWLLWALVDGALVRTLFKAADASFLAADILMEPDVVQPEDPLKTGSSASLIKWTEIGRRGRQFIATAPTVKEISEFQKGPVQDPIRVYVGRRSADTAEDRAKLALEEMIRVGGFERSVLVVMVPVGTGWMDPGAQDTLDFILAGDVATVAVQYSYLSSMLALVAHPDDGVDQARALFNAIYDHWTTLPKDQRPRFYVHGLSQGAFNSQATLPLLDMLRDPIHGAFWAGSPFFSRYWAEVRDQRNPGSPAWRPDYGNGSLIRVMNQYGGLEGDFLPWGPIRAVFLNYGSDPIVNFTFDSAIRAPAWLAEPRAPDVSDKLSWFPIVTMLQLVLDSMFALDIERFGHYYVAPDYIDGWAAVLEPEGWSQDRAAELKEIFSRRPAPF